MQQVFIHLVVIHKLSFCGATCQKPHYVAGAYNWLNSPQPGDTIELNTLRPRQNGRHFADDTFKPIFLNENIRISIRI